MADNTELDVAKIFDGLSEGDAPIRPPFTPAQEVRVREIIEETINALTNESMAALKEFAPTLVKLRGQVELINRALTGEGLQ